MRTEKEWRVVSVNVWGCFKVFDDEISAKRFMGMLPSQDGGDVYARGSLINDFRGPYRLESRAVGGTKDDWKKEPDDTQ